MHRSSESDQMMQQCCSTICAHTCGCTAYSSSDPYRIDASYTCIHCLNTIKTYLRDAECSMVRIQCIQVQFTDFWYRVKIDVMDYEISEMDQGASRLKLVGRVTCPTLGRLAEA